MFTLAPSRRRSLAEVKAVGPRGHVSRAKLPAADRQLVLADTDSHRMVVSTIRG